MSEFKNVEYFSNIFYRCLEYMETLEEFINVQKVYITELEETQKIKDNYIDAVRNNDYLVRYYANKSHVYKVELGRCRRKLERLYKRIIIGLVEAGLSNDEADELIRWWKNNV